MKLNDEQRQLVTDNHNLIYMTANKYNFDLDEYYDILAIGLCKASVRYKPEKGEFSTLAVHIMRQEVYMQYRKNNRRVHQISLEGYSETHVEYEDGVDDLYTNVELSCLDETELEIVNLKFMGLTQNEIAKELGYKQKTISVKLKRIKEKLST